MSLDDLFNNKFKDVVLSNKQIEELYKDIKDYILSKYDGKDIKINTKNVKVEISKLDSQKNTEFSNIDLNNCEKILKDKYGDLLTMLKFDIIIENEKSTYVQYEIYDQTSKKYIELKDCSEINAIINVPIDLESNIEHLYNMLSKSGYNLFDANDPFYNDICAIYTTENETDILLYDRRMDIYRSTVNISLCQKECTFKSYNSETKKAECDCAIQTKEINTNISKLTFSPNEMLDNFYETIKNSNFRVLKCYELVFNIKIFGQNIGSIIMTIILIIFNILMIIYILKSSKKINVYIQNIIKYKFMNNNSNSCNINNKQKYSYDIMNIRKNLDNNNNLNKNKKIKNKEKNKNKEKKKSGKKNSALFLNNILNLLPSLPIKKLETINENPPQKKNNNKFNDDKNSIIKKSKRNSVIDKISCINNLISSNSIPLHSIEMNNNFLRKSIQNDRKKEKIVNIKGININIYNNKIIKSIKSSSLKKQKTALKDSIKGSSLSKDHLIHIKSQIPGKKKMLKSKKSTLSIEELNDYEMNSLEYEKAVELDKRSYFQYYISLIKKNHLILLTFIPTNDYNLMSLKICLFIVSFSLFISVNTLFFNDDTIHSVYKNNGGYIILYQLPHILYSSIIPSIINVILKLLSLSEKDIIKIKEETDLKKAVKNSKKVEKCIKIKFIIFFIFSLLLMLFFWYFISSFCAVYNNTQIALIKDSMISFCLSMLYPFGITLLPGLFRIPAIRAKKKHMKYMYIFSQLLALI